MPRVNVAWDIAGDGTSILRGCYGLFVNRPQGNVDYANALSVPPNAYDVITDAFSQFGLAGQGLTYQTVRLIPLADVIRTQSVNTITPSSFTFPKTHSYSVSYARRILWDQVVEAAYVGTAGRDLSSLVNINVVPYGALNSGVLGNADLSVPVNRAALDPAAVNRLRPYSVYGQITPYDYGGTSQYNSLQVTLSRQTARRLQYFVAYTLSRSEGTLAPEQYPRDPFDPKRTYGVLETDRTHVLTASWNAMLPGAGARGRLDSAFARGLLNGWQLSGISSVMSGTPIHLPFSGDAVATGVSQAYFGTPDVFGFGQGNVLVPVYTCERRWRVRRWRLRSERRLLVHSEHAR